MPHSLRDSDILKLVDSMEYDELISYSKKYISTNLKHYLQLQMKWLSEEKYYTGIELNKNPSEIEFIEHWKIHKNSERFRAYYVLKYPDKVEKIED